MTSSQPNYLPMSHDQNAITLGMRVSTYEFGEETIELIKQVILTLETICADNKTSDSLSSDFFT